MTVIKKIEPLNIFTVQRLSNPYWFGHVTLDIQNYVNYIQLTIFCLTFIIER